MRVIDGGELEHVIQHVLQRKAEGSEGCRVWLNGREREVVRLGPGGPVVKIDGDVGGIAPSGMAWLDSQGIQRLLKSAAG